YDAGAEDKDVRLAVDVPATLPAYGDRALIQQAVANLVDNAVKFSPAGGTVTLRAVSGGRGPSIIVSDQGAGIPATDRGRATERFFRGETARSTPGAGLGLALVQAVAQLHGGELRLGDGNPGLVASLSIPVPEEAVQMAKGA
ncbi:MAG TPA: sensor histidine kinase, partial [Acetobacteraceae bacterium]